MDLRIHAVCEGKKTSKLSVSNINRVDYPSDYIDFVSIAVVENGKAWKLSPNNEFIHTTTEVLGVETLDSDNGEGVDINDGSEDTRYFARGGVNTRGYYQIEHDKRRIALINTSATTVLLTYITSGISLDGHTYIPVKYAMALQAFMAWWNVALDPNIAVSQKQLAEQSYIRLRTELRNSEGPTLEEWEHAILQTFYPTIKR
jgi:hypothetical protein